MIECKDIMIKVFEAFAGYGSQRMALRNLKIPYEVVGISEIVEDALFAYAAIHTDFLEQKKSVENKILESDNDILDFLLKINVPLDYKTFKNKAHSLKKEKLRELFLANKLIKNYGDITKITPKDLPDFDLFTYSFPCQDISVAGYQKGLNVDSGTRSSLLWECCKIIEEKRPKYLLMENVKNLVGVNHIKNFNEFLKYLECLGYTNKWEILNAKDYGVPQNRERVFCVSFLDPNFSFKFPHSLELKSRMSDFMEDNVSDSFYLKKETLDSPITQDVSYCIDSNYWKGSTLENFQQKHRRQLVTDKTPQSNGIYKVRRLTPRETWRLMGCHDSDFEAAEKVTSKTSLYKLAGNSIVVPVLEAIFKNMFLSNYTESFSEIKRNIQLKLF